MFRDWARRFSSRLRGDFPLQRTDSLMMSPSFEGLIVTSDIDKTYLQTRFDTLGDLVRTALESAEEKQSIPGMVPLLRGFREAQAPPTPLYFVSASPPQMRGVLEQKMRLDGLQWDGITFKNQLRLLRQGRWSQIRHHILYKLTALLLNRFARPATAKLSEILIGDDSETDAEAYLLYSRIVNGEICTEEAIQIVEDLGATQREIQRLLPSLRHQDEDKVVRIYIHRTLGRRPNAFPPHHPNLMLAAFDSLQIAIDAWERGWLREEDVVGVATELPPTQRWLCLEESKQRGLFPNAILKRTLVLLRKAALPVVEPEAPEVSTTAFNQPPATKPHPHHAASGPTMTHIFRPHREKTHHHHKLTSTHHIPRHR